MKMSLACSPVAFSKLTLTLILPDRSEEHTSELQSQSNIVCRLLLEKKKNQRAHSQYMSVHRYSAFWFLFGSPIRPYPLWLDHHRLLRSVACTTTSLETALPAHAICL